MDDELQSARLLSKFVKCVAPGKAELLLRDGLKKFPDNIVLWSQLATTLLTLRRPDEALNAIDEIHLRDPNDVIGWGLKAQMLLALGRSREAFVAVEEKLRLAPDDVIGWGLKAQTLLALDQPTEALVAVEEKLRRAPNDVVGWGLKAQTLLALDRPTDALVAVEEKLHHARDDVIGWGLKVQILLALERPEEALKAVEEIHSRAGDDIVGWGLKAQVLLVLERPAEALKAVEEIHQRDPNSPIGWGLQASIYIQSADYSRADAILSSWTTSDDRTIRNTALFVSAISAFKQGDFKRGQDFLTLLQQKSFDLKGCRVWKNLVEAGIGSPERYRAILMVARQREILSATEFAQLLPRDISSDPRPPEMVDSNYLLAQLHRQLSGMLFGEVARSKIFTTSLFPVPIDRTAFDVAVTPKRPGGPSR